MKYLPLSIIRMSFSTAGHCLSDFFNLFVVITPGKKAPILFFRCRDGGQNGDISSSTGDDNDGGPLLRGFGRVMHLLVPCGFDASFVKGGKSNESTDSLIFHRYSVCGVCPEICSFLGDV